LKNVIFPKLRFNSPAVENMRPRNLKTLSGRKENLRVIKSRTERWKTATTSRKALKPNPWNKRAERLEPIIPNKL
jgi:hypothetical protein